jgi:hypothetical protein
MSTDVVQLVDRILSDDADRRGVRGGQHDALAIELSSVCR